MGCRTILSQNPGIAWMGGGLTLAWIFLKDLQCYRKGPQLHLRDIMGQIAQDAWIGGGVKLI